MLEEIRRPHPEQMKDRFEIKESIVNIERRPEIMRQGITYKAEIWGERMLDLGIYGDFQACEIEYICRAKHATIRGIYHPVDPITKEYLPQVQGEIYVELKDPVDDPMDVLEAQWMHFEISHEPIEYERRALMEKRVKKL